MEAREPRAARPCGGRAPGSRGGGGLFSLHSCVRRKNRKNRVSAGRAILIFVENVRAVDAVMGALLRAEAFTPHARRHGGPGAGVATAHKGVRSIHESAHESAHESRKRQKRRCRAALTTAECR